MFEAFDKTPEVPLEFRSSLERVEQFAIGKRVRVRLPCLVVVDVSGDELAEQSADRRLACRILEDLPGGVVDMDACHMVAPLRSRGRRGGLNGAGGSARSAASTTGH